MRKSRALIAAFVALALLAPAQAEHLVVRDGNDTRGRADISKVRVVDDRPRKWAIQTWRRWRVNDFFERGYFVIFFDTLGDKHFDYYVFVRAKRKRLAAAIWRDLKDPARNDVKVANVGVHKAGNRLVNVRVPFRKMKFGDNRVAYRWFVRSIWSGDSCRRLCFDRAPDRHAVREPRVPTP